MAQWMHVFLPTRLMEGHPEADDLALLSAAVWASTVIALAGATLTLLSG